MLGADQADLKRQAADVRAELLRRQLQVLSLLALLVQKYTY